MYPNMYRDQRTCPYFPAAYRPYPLPYGANTLTKDEVQEQDEYRSDEEEIKVEEDIRVDGKEMAQQPKFAPNHNHGSVDHTSVEAGHVHQCLDVTFPPTPTKDGGHVHYVEGYVLSEKGHNHHYKAWSGPAIRVGNGMHVHYYDFYTSEDNGHRHHVTGVDMPAPGER